MLLAVFTLGVASSPTVQSVSHSDHTVCGVEYMEGEWRASKSGKILYEVSAFNASKANSHHPGPVPRPGALGLVCKESESGGKLKNHCGWQSALCYTHPSPSPSPTLPKRVKLSAPEAGAARYSGSTPESKAEHSHNHPGEATTPSRLACTFYSHNGTVISKANGTITTNPYIRSPCSEISGWTNDTAVSNQLWYRTYKKMTCASFVENDVCKTCSGGCENPANCVTCTTQFMSPHGNSEAFYICDGGLEEIRESCNATVGRKPTPVIATNAGKIQGFIDPDSKHAAFRGIPYAQPPVGDLRWRPPQPPTPWTDVKNVSTFGNTCKQMGPMWATMGGVRNSSEDCLYLNVYAPAAHLQKVTAAARAKAKATVMAANTSADVGAEDDADGGLSFDNLFEATAAATQAEEDDSSAAIPVMEVTESEWSTWPNNYEYSSWSGMAPRDLLFEWCRKNKNEKQPPRYTKHSVGGKYKYSVKVPLGTKCTPLEYTPPICVSSTREAQDLCATLALYELAPDAGFHRRLPPPLRNLWMQRKRDSEAKAAQVQKASTAPRDAFVQDLLAVVAQISSTDSDAGTGTAGNKDEGRVRSWPSSAASVGTDSGGAGSDGESNGDGGEDGNRGGNSDSDESVADDWDASSGGGSDTDDVKRTSEGGTAAAAAATPTMAAPSVPGGSQSNTSTATSCLGGSSGGGHKRKGIGRSIDLLQRGLASSSAQRILKTQRGSLPAYRDRVAIVDTIQNNQVTVISGETGCGKSTQVPQLVLQRILLEHRRAAGQAAEADGGGGGGGDDADAGMDCHIVCTQPRRISAISIACRVSDELGQLSPGGLVGYKVRMESKISDATKLEYCTTGVLLRRLQNDPHLSGVSHVVIDEVHERSVDSDFLMLLLRKVLPLRPTLRVVLMSATLDADKIAEYFGGCPVISIPGRTFPVESVYLEDIVEQTGYVLEPDSEYARVDQHGDEDGYGYAASRAADGRPHGSGRSGAAGGYSTAGVHLGGAASTKSQVLTSTAVVADSWDEGGGDGGDGNGDGSVEGSGAGDGSDDRTSAAGAVSSHVFDTVSRMDHSRINYELIEQLIVHIDSTSGDSLLDDGSILVFMPGMVEITKLYSAIMSNPHFYKSDKYHVIALHSSVAAADQRKAFDAVPAGHRKIVISTNIAETGVTIPDCVVVIDAGKVKEMRHREDARMSMLVETFISAASAKQRAGRAGRVRAGKCYRMYTKDAFAKFPQYTTPEILRTPLEALSLHILASKRGSPEELLATALDPPTPRATANAIRTLGEVGALAYDSDGEVVGLSPLGQHLSRLPVHVKLGKMLIFASVFGCLDPALTIAAAVGYKSPFVCPFGKREAADKARRSFAKVDGSDLLGVANAFAGWVRAKERGAAAEFTRRNFLSTPALDTLAAMRDDLKKQLGDVGLWSSKRTSDVNASHKPLLKAVVLAGMYPSVAQLAPAARSGASPVVKCGAGGAGATAGTAQIHPASAVHHRNRPSARGFEYVAFAERVKTSQVFLRDVTVVSPAALLLFGGSIDVQHRAGLVTLDTWIKLRAPAKTAVIFKELRSELDQLLLRIWESPDLDFTKEPLVRAIADVLAA